MFDLGWAELLVIGVVALIIVGPKDLPKLFRTLGQFTGKARAMAREFSTAMNQAADDAGVRDVQNMAADLKKATNPGKLGLDALDEATRDFDAWKPGAKSDRLSPERQEQAEKIRDAAAKKAEERLAREEAAKTAAEAAQAATRSSPKPERPMASAGDDPGAMATPEAQPAPRPAPAPAPAPAAETAPVADTAPVPESPEPKTSGA